MLSKIGPAELLVIIIVLLLIFGPTMLPKLGKSVGKTLASFKKGLKEEDETPIEMSSASKQDSTSDTKSGS